MNDEEMLKAISRLFEEKLTAQRHEILRGVRALLHLDGRLTDVETTIKIVEQDVGMLKKAQ